MLSFQAFSKSSLPLLYFHVVLPLFSDEQKWYTIWTMPEGFSPEFKRVPDALQAGSGSSPREKPHQPKIETASNISRHPSETFPWLPKEEYFRQRDQYLPTMIPVVEHAIASDPLFKYKDDSEITKTVATLYSRALFVAEYLNSQSPQKHMTPICYSAETSIVNNRVIAQTAPVFNLTKQEIEDSSTDIDKIKLEYIYIRTNMNFLGKHVETIRDVATEELIEKGLPLDFAEQRKAQELDEEGLAQEAAMAHEMGHAFYDIKAASNPESLRKFIEELKNYRAPPWETNDDIPEEEEERLYTNSPLEQDANKWKVAFMQRYYPQKLKQGYYQDSSVNM